MKSILVFAAVMTTLICLAQNKKADMLYDKGIEAYNSENFRAADSLFGLSAEIQPNRDVYYNLAIVKNKLGDQCESCKYLKLAGNLGDDKAFELFKKHCIIIDSIVFENPAYYCRSKQTFCQDDISFNFYKRGQEGADSIVLLKNDSLLTKEYIMSSKFNIEETIDTVVFSLNEIQPEFPGGPDALMEFLARNIKYPVNARENNIQGTVYVTYIIEPDGKVTNIKVVQGIGGGCDEEAIRVVSIMPQWKPGMQLNKPVRVQFTLPIRFILSYPTY
ncbi:MAG: energy transducer TonB [Bacteroidales bacterium]